MEIKSWKELNKNQKKKKKISGSKNTGNKNPVKKGSAINNDLEKDIKEFYQQDFKEQEVATEKTNDQNNNRSNFMKKNQKKSKWHGKGFWLMIALILAASFLLIVSAFRFAGPPTGSEDMQISIEGPNQVAIGEEGSWIIKYQNSGQVDLTNVRLIVKYPRGFKLKNLNPQASNDINTAWEINDLSAGEQGEISIEGQIFGQEEEEVEFQLEVVYQPVNFSSDFAKQYSYSINLGSSQVRLILENPESTLPESEQPFNIKVENISGQEINDLELRLVTSFYFSMSDPDPDSVRIEESGDEKIYIWDKRNWSVSEEFQYNFQGKFSAAARGVEEMRVELVRYDEEEGKIIQEKQIRMAILGEELLLSLKINDQDTLPDLSAGQELNFDIDLKNTSGQDLQDITVELQVSPEFIDWQTLTAPVQPQITSQGKISFSSSTLAELSLLEVGGEINIPLTMSLKNILPAGENKFQTYASARIDKLGDEKKEDLIFSTKIFSKDIKIPVKIRPSARYRNDEGIPVGSGPHPPRAGETTTYEILLALEALEELSDISVQFFLSSKAQWLDEKSVSNGTLFYQNSNNSVLWEKNEWQIGDQTDISFKLSVTPNNSDVGNTIPLVEKILFSALLAEQEFEIESPSLNTDLQGALYESNKGEVQPGT